MVLAQFGGLTREAGASQAVQLVGKRGFDGLTPIPELSPRDESVQTVEQVRVEGEIPPITCCRQAFVKSGLEDL